MHYPTFRPGEQEDRDIRGINRHIQVNFSDALGEPDSVHSNFYVWIFSKYCFSCVRDFLYGLCTCFCGMCMATYWGCQFACLTFEHVWCFTPFGKCFDLFLLMFARLTKPCINCFIVPITDACGHFLLVFSEPKNGLQRKNENYLKEVTLVESIIIKNVHVRNEQKKKTNENPMTVVEMASINQEGVNGGRKNIKNFNQSQSSENYVGNVAAASGKNNVKGDKHVTRVETMNNKNFGVADRNKENNQTTSSENVYFRHVVAVTDIKTRGKTEQPEVLVKNGHYNNLDAAEGKGKIKAENQTTLSENFHITDRKIRAKTEQPVAVVKKDNYKNVGAAAGKGKRNTENQTTSGENVYIRRVSVTDGKIRRNTDQPGALVEKDTSKYKNGGGENHTTSRGNVHIGRVDVTNGKIRAKTERPLTLAERDNYKNVRTAEGKGTINTEYQTTSGENIYIKRVAVLGKKSRTKIAHDEIYEMPLTVVEQSNLRTYHVPDGKMKLTTGQQIEDPVPWRYW